MAKTATKKAEKPAKAVRKTKPKPATRAAAAKSAAVKKPALKPKVPEKKAPAKPVKKPELKLAPKPVAKPAAVTAAGKKPEPPKEGVPPQLKVAVKPGEPGDPNAQREDADSPLLDMSDVAVRKMVTKAKARGYVTYDELNKVLPSEKVSSEQIEDTMSMLNEMGINVIESEEQEEQAEGAVPALAEGKQVTVTAKEGEETYDRTDDPVRMYLREMGSVELLSREGEIAIAKRIEAGRELMIGALCESPLTFEALTVWRDELNEGKVLLRDIIDLEAMYGAGPDGQPANVPPPVGPDGKPLNTDGANGAAAGGPPPVKFKKPEPPKPPAPKPAPAPKAEGEEGEGGEAQAAADGQDEDFDDEGNLPLSAMEAALKPQVLASLDAIAGLYKKLGKLQDASVEAALASDELSSGQERRFKKLRNETMDLVKSLKLNNNRIEALVDQMYGINKRLVGLEGKLLRLAESHGVDRSEFLKQYFGNELDPNWARRVGRLSGLGWHEFVTDEPAKIKALREKIQPSRCR